MIWRNTADSRDRHHPNAGFSASISSVDENGLLPETSALGEI
jgi:hypothetical protein